MMFASASYRYRCSFFLSFILLLLFSYQPILFDCFTTGSWLAHFNFIPLHSIYVLPLCIGVFICLFYFVPKVYLFLMIEALAAVYTS